MSRRSPIHFCAGLLLSFIFISTAQAAPHSRILMAKNGAIHWTVDHTGTRREGLLFIAQGSGCAPVKGDPNFIRAEAALPMLALVTVEKRGVDPNGRWSAREPSCSLEYRRVNTVSQRAADAAAVLRTLRAERWWNGQVVLFGGSEGGAVVAMLAKRVHPTAVIIMSTAPGRSFRTAFLNQLSPAERPLAIATFAKVHQSPQADRIFAGQSFNWWADILDHDLTADLLKVQAPILLMQGAQDRSAPVSVARDVAAAFKAASHEGFTYWEFPAYDHQMRDAAGVSHLDEVLAQANSWLQAPLHRSAAEGAHLSFGRH